MSFLSTFVYNMIATTTGLVCVIFVGMAVLKVLPAGRKRFGLWRTALAAACLAMFAWTAAWFYKKGFLDNFFVSILMDYLQLIGYAWCVSFLFRVKFRKCWGIVLFEECVRNFANVLTFISFTDRPLVLSIPEERRTYLFLGTVGMMAVFLLLLFVLYKMKVTDAYRQWVEYRNIWSWGMICLSAYPILFYGATGFLMGGGASRNVSMGITLLMLTAALLLFHHMGMEAWQRKEFAAQELILQQQNVYIKTLEGMQEEMRRFEHDYKNMISGLCLTAKEGELTEANRFLQEMEEDFHSQIGGQIRQIEQLSNVRITEVKGLLLAKLAGMQREGTACELEVMRLFRQTRLRTTDLCRCLGILIDNAMEEVRGQEDARVHIMISSQERYTTFRVKNRLYHGVDVHRIWQQGYSTKGPDRGLGLVSYRKILEGYEDVLPATAVQEGYFIQEFKVQERNAK